MIKIENVVLASPEQMNFIIQGMRNANGLYEKGDSNTFLNNGKAEFIFGKRDYHLMQQIADVDAEEYHKYLRMMPVYVRITAPIYWWNEMGAFKVDTIANPNDLLAKIKAEKFGVTDFSVENCPNFATFEKMNLSFTDAYLNTDSLTLTIKILNFNRQKYLDTKDIKYWQQIIQFLPSSYNQTRDAIMNYEILSNIYKSHKWDKFGEWQTFCNWIESLPYSELIIRKEGNDY